MEKLKKTRKCLSMRLLVASFMVLFVSCKKSPDHRSQLIFDLIESLKQEEVSVGMVQSKYFFEEEIAESEDKYGLYLLILSSFRDEINKSSEAEVLLYQEAIDQEIDVYRIDGNAEDIYVILLKDKEGEIFNKTYCLMSEGKIQSLSVLRKGQTVIGWN
ncbi:hypothetical protein [Pontibacter sp. G13]|uniref:hypothetical protein n=1 Tax=Pontibacter sp. G13 TaxID=3074898 RepID=UPI0028895505|nr:hypothetical protein [Pontibacter sp. G13]WNJ16437.1 hypothetical protein RJD25_16350 [Pontibacter sp. G13]